MNLKVIAALAAMAALSITSGASAAPVVWTQWAPGSLVPSPISGSALGAVGANSVTYTGAINDLTFNYPSWDPNSTWEGGDVANAPPSANGAIKLMGGQDSSINTISFGVAVKNPVIAIWSLGQGGGEASFDFLHITDSQIALVAGGPSTEYGGGPLTLSGTTVSGFEGNGTVQLFGTFKTISFTTPQFENYYDFTVGVGGVPEPATWSMMLLSFFGLGSMVRLAARKKYLIAGA
jgi:hypothetical protein